MGAASLEGVREERPTDGRSEGRSDVELKNAPGQGRGVLGERRRGLEVECAAGGGGGPAASGDLEAPRRGPRWRPREEPLRQFPDLPRPPMACAFTLCPQALSPSCPSTAAFPSFEVQVDAGLSVCSAEAAAGPGAP